jgi:hypothetical protein
MLEMDFIFYHKFIFCNENNLHGNKFVLKKGRKFIGSEKFVAMSWEIH